MNPFIIFASLPDMGRVGGLTSSFLVDHLSAQHIASIYSNEKPWIGVIEGIVENIVEEYKIFASKEHGLIIFNGGSQPEDPSELFGLCNMFIDFCQSIGSIRRLYTSGGSFNENAASTKTDGHGGDQKPWVRWRSGVICTITRSLWITPE